jgi:hypothetical protein
MFRTQNCFRLIFVRWISRKYARKFNIPRKLGISSHDISELLRNIVRFVVEPRFKCCPLAFFLNRLGRFKDCCQMADSLHQACTDKSIGRLIDIGCDANCGGKTLMKLISAVVLCAAGLTAVTTFAQSQPANPNMQFLSDKVKADKKLVVAANMDLNEAEGKAFWPIYDAYQKELHELNDRLVAAIVGYADAYNKDTLTDEMATSLTNTALSIEQDEVTLQKTYATRLKGVLPGKKIARYLQIESKIRALVRYEMADNIPLVP